MDFVFQLLFHRRERSEYVQVKSEWICGMLETGNGGKREQSNGDNKKSTRATRRRSNSKGKTRLTAPPHCCLNPWSESHSVAAAAVFAAVVELDFFFYVLP